MKYSILPAIAGFFAMFAFGWQGAVGEEAGRKYSADHWENIAESVRQNPDVVLVCEYAQEYKADGLIPDYNWDCVTSCTVIESVKGNLKKGQKIQIHETFEKNRPDDPAPKPEMGNLSYVFYDSAKGWVETGEKWSFDVEIEKHVKAAAAKSRKAKSQDR